MSNSSRSLKIIILILSVLLIGSSFFLYEKIQLQDETISTLTDLSEKQKDTISDLEMTITALEKNLSVTEESLKNETQARQNLELEIVKLTMVAKSDYGVLAVDETNKGHVIPLEVIIKNGSGKLFLNVANVLFDETLQSSAQTSIRVAREITRGSLFDKDVLININAPAQEQGLIISGGSAGAAITLTTMAAIQGRTIRNDVLITGTINEDHTIGRVGATRAKGLAAKENGAVLFLVPVGQESAVGEVGIEVREVRTIEEAATYTIPVS